MTKTLYTTDLDLGSSQLEKTYPDKAYVRHGGRKFRTVKHKDGTTSQVSSIDWKEENVTKVWVDRIENTDGVEIRNSYELHLLIDNRDHLVINLTAKQYNRLSDFKYTRPALDLLIKILRKEGKGLLIRKLPTTKKFSFRAHKKVAELIAKESERCGLSEGEYIERCCAGISPRLALDEEEKKIIREFAKGRQDFQFFFNMMSIWLKGKDKQQIAEAVIMGEKCRPLRQRLIKIMQEWDEILGMLLNRQIQSK